MKYSLQLLTCEFNIQLQSQTPGGQRFTLNSEHLGPSARSVRIRTPAVGSPDLPQCIRDSRGTHMSLDIAQRTQGSHSSTGNIPLSVPKNWMFTRLTIISITGHSCNRKQERDSSGLSQPPAGSPPARTPGL